MLWKTSKWSLHFKHSYSYVGIRSTFRESTKYYVPRAFKVKCSVRRFRISRIFSEGSGLTSESTRLRQPMLDSTFKEAGHMETNRIGA